MNRKIILDEIQRNLENNISELTQALNDYESASNFDEGDTLDPEDFSQQAEFKEMQLRMKIQLDQANAQLEHLSTLANKKTTFIEAGAIAETSQHVIFFGVSFPAIHLDAKELLGITTETPIYASLKGKTKGDHFKMGKKNIISLRFIERHRSS